MACSKEFLDFILDGLSELDGISHRQMMGEYIIYRHGKIAAYLCDNRMLVKILPSTLSLMPDAKRESPYEGAKDMLVVEDVDNREFLALLFNKMQNELPDRKKKAIDKCSRD